MGGSLYNKSYLQLKTIGFSIEQLKISTRKAEIYNSAHLTSHVQ